MTTATVRSKRSVQIPLLKAAALRLAEKHGETIIVFNRPVTEMKLAGLLIWISPMGPNTNLDVWDEGNGGAKVLNVAWTPTGAMEVMSFRRGHWEDALLSLARQTLQ
jgi:hypothetical protein